MLKQNETFVQQKPNKIEITLNGNGGPVYHFIALPQNWTIKSIYGNGYGADGAFSIKDYSLDYTNNGIRNQNVPMKLTYLNNPTANRIIYTINLN